MYKNFNLIDFFVLILLLFLLFFGGSLTTITHFLEILIVSHFFLKIKEYWVKNIIYLSLLIIYGIVVSLVIDLRYFVKFYYNILIPMILFFYGYKQLDLKKITSIYLILSLASITMLYFSFQTLQEGFEYKEGYYISEFSRVYQHFITGRLFTATDALLFAIPIIFFTFFLILSKKNIFLIFVYILILLYIINVTKTRSIILFLIALLFCLLYSKFKFNINKSLFFIIISFVMVYFSLDSFGIIPERFSINYNSNVGLNERDLIWALYLFQITTSPFGNFERIEFNYLEVSSHNTILEYFYSLGWLIGGLFIIYYTKNILFFVKNFLNSNNIKTIRIFSIMMLVLFVFLNLESVPDTNNYAFYSIAVFTGFYFKFIKEFAIEKRS